jgi:hypothetical protein
VKKIRISKKDLKRLLADNEHLQQQVKELQEYSSGQLLENRALQARIEEMKRSG